MAPCSMPKAERFSSERLMDGATLSGRRIPYKLTTNSSWPQCRRCSPLKPLCYCISKVSWITTISLRNTSLSSPTKASPYAICSIIAQAYRDTRSWPTNNGPIDASLFATKMSSNSMAHTYLTPITSPTSPSITLM